MATQLDNLERLRLSLEENIAKLRKSLKYWQTWEYEHEGLKEELERPDQEPSSDDMLAIGTDLGLDIVDEKEIKSLLDHGKSHPRTRSQVFAQLRGRIETGRKNAETIQKQLTAAEEKLEKVLMVAEPIMESEGGDQLMDIVEELDDDGNVVSSRVVDASKDREKLHHMLKRQGLTDEADENAEEEVKRQETKPAVTKQAAHPEPQEPTNEKKKVSFANGVQASQIPKAPPANKMHATQRMLILDENDNVVDSKPLELVHAKTSAQEEDEMKYLREARANAQEIAPIVASFDIEEDSDSDMDTDMDDLDSDGSENEYGMRNIGAEITDDYKAQMEALMKKHAVAMENAGPNFNTDVLQKLDNAHREGGIIVKPASEPAEQKSKTPGSKGVRFAEELDISPAPIDDKPKTSKDEPVLKQEKAANPVADAVLERGAGITQADSKVSSARKPSRFKTTMNTSANRLPDREGTSGSTSSSSTIPQIATHSETSLPERPKKVSRFKATQMGS
jgi:unconventional prefoldin RPB5 interactor 1